MPLFNSRMLYQSVLLLEQKKVRNEFERRLENFKPVDCEKVPIFALPKPVEILKATREK